MRIHRRVPTLFGLGALAAFGLSLLLTVSAGSLESAKGLQRYVAVPSTSDSEPTASAAVNLAAISELQTPQERVMQVEEASSAPGSDSPRTLQVAQWQVSGHVVALDGLALSGHAIRLGGDAPEVERTRSDAAGSFTMSVPARSDVLVAGAPGFVTVAGTRAQRREQGLVVALPAHRYTVNVGDAKTGLPLTAARVTPVPSDALQVSLEAARLKFAPSAEFVSSTLSSRSTSRTGLAAFDRLPGPEWVDALVTRPGYNDQRVSFDATTDGSLAVWLEHASAEGDWRGRVLDAEGRPLSSAWVACGSVTVRAAGDGSFTLPTMESHGEPIFLDAYHPGYGESRTELGRTSTESIELRISEAVDPLRVRLHIRSGSGASEPSSSVRLLPLDSKGRADFLGPFWRTGQTNADGIVELPQAMAGARMVAYSKGGSELGHFELQAGDIVLATD